MDSICFKKPSNGIVNNQHILENASKDEESDV